jgi:hypothetical protein
MLAGRIGPSLTLTINGGICLFIIAVFYSQLPKLRHAAAPVLAAQDATSPEAAAYAEAAADSRPDR